MSEESNYLSRWLGEIKGELDNESIRTIHDTLKANQFSSRLKLKLITKEQLDTMFSGNNKLSLGMMAVLRFKLEQLKDESPLVKGKKIRTMPIDPFSQQSQTIQVKVEKIVFISTCYVSTCFVEVYDYTRFFSCICLLWISVI